jgi:hypothetical protein
MVKVCYNKPNRKRPRVYTEKDVGRIVAYARNDGASDTLLIAYIMQSFGLRKLQCVIFKILDVLNTAFFLAALIGLLKGIIYIIKGLRIVATGKRGIATAVLDIIVPKRYLTQLGIFYLWTGSVEAVLSATILFITAISNNVALYLLMKGICEAEVAPLSVVVQNVDVGDIGDRLDEIRAVIESIDE